MNLRTRFFAAAVLLFLVTVPAGAVGKEAGTVVPRSEADRISYSIGYQIGGDLKRVGQGIASAALRQGLKDAKTGTPTLQDEEMRALLRALQKSIFSVQKAEAAGESLNSARIKKETLDQGRKFLVVNSSRKGVVTRPSGLQYKEIKQGIGRLPGPGDTVVVRYRGTTSDGREFYNTERKGKPADVKVREAIPGLREALVLMKEGARWEIFIPAKLAYGERGPLADQTVVFDLELISVKKTGGAK